MWKSARDTWYKIDTLQSGATIVLLIAALAPPATRSLSLFSSALLSCLKNLACLHESLCIELREKDVKVPFDKINFNMNHCRVTTTDIAEMGNI